MCAAPVAPPAGSVSAAAAARAASAVADLPPWWRLLGSRLVTFSLLELRKIRHDRTEIYTRAIQPMLWLLIFGETFTRIKAIPTGRTPYLEFLAPGIMAQSALFVAIFYGIMIIWERDFGILTKLMATPTPRIALITGKAFAAGLRSVAQVVAILALCAVLRIEISWNPLRLLGVVLVVVLGSAFFATLSMTIAGLVLSRDRLMGIGQAITMPLFFGSNALYPTALMPGWLQGLARVNPLSYEVDALRGLLVGTDSSLALDVGVLVVAAVAGIVAASALLHRLTR
ncbi:MAG TPA: ABC transporter permease [Candidatus Angelobacter sp.]|jgi:ABC-2 type transport system permease protein|nr:ABC transporter permease [Candidatus Angelobacter sp.]